MRSELAKIAVASTAATVLIWLLSLMAPRCLCTGVSSRSVAPVALSHCDS
jgi:hypothetical protein